MRHVPVTKLLHALLAVGVGFVAACGSPTPGGTIKVVSSLPMTGDSLTHTQSIVNALAMSFEAVDNSVCGGKWAIQYEAFDDAPPGSDISQTQKATDNANVFLADRSVVAVVAPFTAEAARAVVPLLNKEGLIVLSPAVTDPALTKPNSGNYDEPDKYYPSGTRNFARLLPADDFQALAAVAWAKQWAALSVYVLDDQDLSRRAVADLFASQATQEGIRVLGHESIDATADQHAALSFKMATLNPDIIFLSATSQTGAGALARDLRLAGYTGGLLATSGVLNEQFLQTASVASEGVIVFSPLAPSGHYEGEALTWRQDYENVYGTAPSPYALYGFAAGQVLLDAFERVCAGGGQPDNRELVRAAVMQTNRLSAAGITIEFDANGDVLSNKIGIYKVSGGQFEWVDWYGK